MAGGTPQGPWCQVERPACVEDGTLARRPSPTAGPLGGGAPSARRDPRSPTPNELLDAGATCAEDDWAELDRLLRVALDPAGAFAGGAVRSLTAAAAWDAFQRGGYVRQAAGVPREAYRLVVHARALRADAAAAWAFEERGKLRLLTRGRSTPLGNTLAALFEKERTFEDLMARYRGSPRALIKAAGRARPAFNAAAAVVRVAGPALLLLDFGQGAAAVASAPEGRRRRVALEELVPRLCGLAGGALGATLALAPPLALAVSVSLSGAAAAACATAVDSIDLVEE